MWTYRTLRGRWEAPGASRLRALHLAGWAFVFLASACGDDLPSPAVNGGAGGSSAARPCLSFDLAPAAMCPASPRLSIVMGETRRLAVRLQGPEPLSIEAASGSLPAGITVTLEPRAGGQATLVASATAASTPQTIALVVKAPRTAEGAALALHVVSPLDFGGNDEGPDLAIDPGGRSAFVADCVAGARLVRVGLPDLRAVATVALGYGDEGGACATAVAIEPSGASALVGLGRSGFNGPDGRLLRVDLATGATTTVATGLTRPRAIAIEPGGASALVSDDLAGQTNQRLSRVDLSTGTLSPIAPSLRARALLLEAGGRSVLALGTEGAAPLASRLSRIDLASGGEQLLATLEGVDSGAPRMVLDPTGGAVLTPSLVRIDLATGRSTRLVGDSFGGTAWPSFAIAAAPDGTYVRLFGGRLERVHTGLPMEILTTIDGVAGPLALDARTLAAFVAGRTEVARFDLGSRSSSRQAYVPAGERYFQRLVLDAQSGPAYAIAPGTASIDGLDLASGAIDSLVPGLSCGLDVAAEAAGTALVLEGCANRLVRLEPGTGLLTPVAAELEPAPTDGSRREVVALMLEAGGRTALLGLGALVRLDLATGEKEVLYPGPTGGRLQTRDDRRLVLGDAHGLFELDLSTGARTRYAIAEPLSDFSVEPRGVTALLAVQIQDPTTGISTGTKLVRLSLR